MSRLWRRLGLALLIAALCAPALALEEVRLQLKWSHAFQFAGYYAARELGYYRAAGLDVRIEAATPGINPVDEVVSGRAEYGIGSSSLLLGRHAGQPLVVLAVVFQHSPLVLIARHNPPLKGIQELAGKRVMLEPQSEELLAYLRREHVASEQIRLLPHSYQPDDLIQGRVDAISAYASNETYHLEQAGVPYQIFTPRSAGIDFYGDNLFTSEREIADHPQRVEAFRAASLRGWAYAMAHPEEIADLIAAKYAPQLPRDFLTFEAQRMAELMRTDLIEVGYMTPGRWRHIADTYAELGLIGADFKLDGFLYRPPEDNALSRARRDLTLALIVIALGGLLTAYVYRTNHRLRRAQNKLALSEERYRMLTENMKDVAWTLDTETLRFTYVSPSIERLRGYTPEEIIARPIDAELAPDGQALVRRAIAERTRDFRDGTLLPSTYFTHELEQACKDGSRVWTEVVSHYVRNEQSGHIEIHGVTRDITERKRQEEQIRHMAQHDPLTGLANRALFSHHFEQVLTNARRDHGRLALIYLDLDNFKPINDNFGHAVGDQLLQAAATRLQSALRESDIIARFGGDEFVILLRHIDDDDDAFTVADKIRQTLLPAFELAGQQMHISSSLGVAIYPGHGETEIELSHHADSAMYHAKHAGRNTVRLYDPQTMSN